VTAVKAVLNGGASKKMKRAANFPQNCRTQKPTHPLRDAPELEDYLSVTLDGLQAKKAS